MAVDVFTGQVIEEKERPARDVFTGGLITDKPDSSVYELTERLSQEAGLPQDNVKWHEYLLSADPTFNKKEGESTQDYAKRYTTGLVKTLKEYPSKPEAHAFEQGFSFAPSKKPEDIAQKKEHPIIYNTGRLAQTIVLASGFGKMTKAIAPIVTNSIPVFSKVFPKIARAMGGIAHSFVVGLGVGATKETIKQIRDYEKGVDVGKVTKEGLWTGAAFAPWGVIPTTEIGATLGESVLKAGLKRGGAAFGVVGASSTIVTLMRKGEITSEDLGWILVNATTAAVLNGYNAKQIAQANRGSRQHDFMIREMANKYRNVKPNASQKEAEAFAELAYGTGLTKNTYAYIKQIEDNVNPIYKRLQAEKAVVKPSTPSAKEGVPMPKTPVEAPLTPEIIPKEPIIEPVAEEIKPLVTEAKKFKTAEEFRSAIRKQFIEEQKMEPQKEETLDKWFQAKQRQKVMGVGAERASELPKLTEMPEGKIKDIGITSEGKVKLYRGTPKDVKDKKIRYGDFLSPKKSKAQFYGEVTEHILDAKDIGYISENDLVYAKETEKILEPKTYTIADIWSKAQEKPTGKPSKVATSVEEKAIAKKLTESFSELAQYTPITIKEQAKKIDKLIKTDIEKAKQIIKGEEPLPKGLLGGTVIKAMEDYAVATGDVSLIMDIANSPLTAETSVHAQELRTLAERSPTSPVKVIGDVTKAREVKAVKRHKVKSTNKLKTDTVKEIKTEIKKVASTKETWSDFIKSIQC